MKSGTSSLHGALSLHPDIFMSTPKEPAFFVPGRFRPKDVYADPFDDAQCEVEYLRLFDSPANKQYRGEASTHYTMLPRIPSAAERLYAFDPGARIIYVTRDPAERTISHYWWNCRFHEEVRKPLDAVRGDPLYTAFSYYAMQLQPYLSLFGRKQIHVVTMEELCNAPGETLGSICAWLGLDSIQGMTDFSKENATPSIVVQQRSWFFAKLRKSRVYKSMANLVPKPFRTFARHLNEREVDRVEEDVTEARAYLRSIQRPQIEEFEAQCGRRFICWPSVVAFNHSRCKVGAAP